MGHTMAYRFDNIDASVLLWQDDDIFNYQAVYFIDGFDNRIADIPLLDFSNLGFSMAKPFYAPPIVNDDVIGASAIMSVIDVFADNGNGYDSDPDGDSFSITLINGNGIAIGDKIVLASGLELVFLASGQFNVSAPNANLGDILNDGFTYTVEDINGDIATASVTINFSVNALDPSTIPASAGYQVGGAGDGTGLGAAVAALGDVNNDGIDDYIIGASEGLFPGFAFIVFGSVAGFPGGLNLGALDGTNGFSVSGPVTLSQFGAAVSSAGDINGDGIADILIGAPGAGTVGLGGDARGEAYVIFGTAGGYPANFSLAGLDGTNGFVLQAGSADGGVGFALSSAGDINGDGFDDILIGSQGNREVGITAGAYVVYGTASPFAANIDLSQLDGSNGFGIPALTVRDGTGQAVTGLGDVNGDGVDDFAIGAPGQMEDLV